MRSYLVINGPNLAQLGGREVNFYGTMSLDEIKDYTQKKISVFSEKIKLSWIHSNSEAEIITQIQCFNTKDDIDGLIINPGAFSHTSVAILDALRMSKKPVAEVHLSLTHKRETYRRVKLTALGADIVLEGLGADVYHTAVYSLINHNRHLKKG